MPKRRTDRPGQIGDWWLSKRPGSDHWQRTGFDPVTRQTRRFSLGDEDFRDFQKAVLKLAEWVTDHQRLVRAPIDDVPLQTILKRYWDRHASKIRSAKPRAIELRYWSEHFDAAMVGDVTPEQIDALVTKLREAGKSTGYISRVLDAGRAALNHAHKRGELASVPFVKDIETAADRRNKQPMGAPMTVEQMTALLDAAAARPHMLRFVMIAACTLARPEAVLELTRFQVDREHDRIDLNPRGRQQTKKYRPIVPIARTLRPSLEPEPVKPWPKRRKRPEPKVVTDRLVTYAGRPVKSIKTAWRDLLGKAGLPAGITPYSIRHTMARELRKRRVPTESISLMLGHLPRGSAATTSIYAPYDPDYCRDAIEAIDAYFDAISAARRGKRAEEQGAN